MILLTLGTASAYAQYYSSQYRMVIRTIDGLTYPFNVERVDSVYFEIFQSEVNDNDEDETTVTGGVTEITNNTATITSWANILDNLSSDIIVGIIYATEGTPNKSNGTQITVSTSSLGNDAKYTIKLTGLTPSTTYYYRSFVFQSGIWFYGDVKEFTTKGQGVSLASGEVSKLTCYSAKVSGSVSIDESTQYSTLTYGICYGTGSEPTVNDSKVQANSKDQDGNFSCQFRALTGSTTYYYRAYAYVDGYLSYGATRSFTTKDDDIVTTGDIDAESFTVRSALKISSGAYSTLVLGVCYGTNEIPTVSDQTVTTNEVDDENNFTLTLHKTPYGKFYYRSFVKIDGVAHYGNVKSFVLVAHAVDLGLSVKWASFNVGASHPEDYGDYYAWGETEPKELYSWSNYKWRNTHDKITKYNTDSRYGTDDNKETLDLEDDVAHEKWGGFWHMPTMKDWIEMADSCTWIWYSSGNTEFNGVAGYKVTSNIEGYKDRSIFLPAAGYRDGTGLYNVGNYGNYWTSKIFTTRPEEAFFGSLREGGVWYGANNRYYGQSVRPVYPTEDWFNNVTITLNSDSMYVFWRSTFTLIASLGNYVIDENIITWTSADTSIATVSGTGVVTGVAEGSTTITATYLGKTATCTITVPEYVDLGLSVIWAAFNIGATTPEQYGDYYAWGETKTKSDYCWSTYKWCHGSYTTQTKYNTKSSYGTVDNKTTLDATDDVAHVKWGGNWRMPTKAEQDELRTNCTWTWTTLNGVNGYRVTSKKTGYTDRSIFLPAAGCRDGTSLYDAGSGGYYWSSSLRTDGPGGAWNINFGSGHADWYNSNRLYGRSVRPVCP